LAAGRKREKKRPFPKCPRFDVKEEREGKENPTTQEKGDCPWSGGLYFVKEKARRDHLDRKNAVSLLKRKGEEKKRERKERIACFSKEARPLNRIKKKG